MNPKRELKGMREQLRAAPSVRPAGAPLGIVLPGAETPGLLAETVTGGKLKRTALWRLFDRVALALLNDLVDNVLILCPPQVGKSLLFSMYLPAFWLSRNPEHRVVLGAYSTGFAGSWGRKVRDLISRNTALFGGLRVREDVHARGEFELVDHEGSMISAGVEGGISGRPANLVIGDDLVADTATASSAIEREKLFAWVEEELFARLQRNGKKLIIMTRRHPDDVAGRLIRLAEDGKESWEIIRLPALAEEDENWPRWGWSRKQGEALVPELHDVAELERTRLARGPHVWSGLYQQRPTPRGGGDLKSEWFRVVEADPGYVHCVRSWDLAGSESPRAARTAGVLMQRRFDSGVTKYHVPSVRFGRWSPAERDRVILETALVDGRGVPIIIEQEPGSGGLAQVQALISKLSGWSVKAVLTGGSSKELRADPMASQAGVGNLSIRSAPWNAEFLAEVDGFPDGGTIDMVDAAAHAFNNLAAIQEDILPSDEMYSPEDDIPGRIA
jgi:hypothetical protein